MGFTSMDLADPDSENPDLPTTCYENEDEFAIAEELAASNGDESEATIDGLGVDLGESEKERVDEEWAKAMLVIVADEC